MIYFDHNATTPILPEVQEEMNLAMRDYWGNPSSTHSVGRKAFAQLEKARERLASLLGAKAKEIFFTSGGTEADNLAIQGIAKNYPGCEILVSAIEHPAVHDAAHALSMEGFTVKDISVDEKGLLKLQSIQSLLSEKTKLISVMLANNEIGTIQPIEQIRPLLQNRDIVVHSDAVQAFGKIPINVQNLNVDLLSISAHKIYGPKGCGAIFIKQGTKIFPKTFGGNQERGIRTGTENVPAILGFVKAAEMAILKIEHEYDRLKTLTSLLFDEISSKIETIILNGDMENKIPGTLNICFSGAETESIIASLDQEGICVSGGSACSSGSISASRTLLSIGRRKVDAVCAIRFSLGLNSTKDEVLKTVEVLTSVVKRIRIVNQ